MTGDLREIKQRRNNNDKENSNSYLRRYTGNVRPGQSAAVIFRRHPHDMSHRYDPCCTVPDQRIY